MNSLSLRESIWDLIALASPPHVQMLRTSPRLTKRDLERFHTLIADKGYDDRAHRQRLRSWKKHPLIKHRELEPYDRGANARMDQKLYHRRSLVETVISVLKRKYGSEVRSRVWWRQFRELVALCLVYNLERAVKVSVAFCLAPLPAANIPSAKDFYRAVVAEHLT